MTFTSVMPWSANISRATSAPERSLESCTWEYSLNLLFSRELTIMLMTMKTSVIIKGVKNITLWFSFLYFIYNSRSGISFCKGNSFHISSCGRYNICAHNIFGQIIASLHQHIGHQRLNELQRRISPEENHRIDKLQSRQDTRTRHFVLKRTPVAFETPHGSIGI